MPAFACKWGLGHTDAHMNPAQVSYIKLQIRFLNLKYIFEKYDAFSCGVNISHACLHISCCFASVPKVPARSLCIPPKKRAVIHSHHHSVAYLLASPPPPLPPQPASLFQATSRPSDLSHAAAARPQKSSQARPDCSCTPLAALVAVRGKPAVPPSAVEPGSRSVIPLL
jgi:hypothetical protein